MARSKKDKQDDERTRPLEGEYIAPAPMRLVNLNTDRTERYVQQLLDMGDKQARDILLKGIQIKLMLINDQILAQLEILAGSMDARERLTAANIITQLTAVSSQITENKIKLDKALGSDLENLLPRSASTEVSETSEAEFESRYGQAAVKPIQKLLAEPISEPFGQVDPRPGNA